MSKLDDIYNKVVSNDQKRDFIVTELRPGDSSSPRVWRDTVDGTLYDFVFGLESPSTLMVGTVRTAYLNYPVAPATPLGNGYIAPSQPASWNPAAEFTHAPNGDIVRKRTSGFDSPRR